jgi:hypothetical protein
MAAESDSISSKRTQCYGRAIADNDIGDRRISPWRTGVIIA